VAANQRSYTGKYLQGVLQQHPLGSAVAIS
jgi:excinuclease ABC subunit A